MSERALQRLDISLSKSTQECFVTSMVDVKNMQCFIMGKMSGAQVCC